ncbi:toll/interleukin-1 receptor domain-containing protein [Sphingomonadaceae bacterium]|nr:toll/interleukin-1 receptor domain-containing protein [Sphingomonadaceae bacterium]
MTSGNTSAVGRENFKAFISYSHADKIEAQRLHRKLEAYRLPQHLRDTAANSRSDGLVGPIFRDRDDLPAAADLTESVQKALAASQVLIVVCSPDARNSLWVAREIELFRDLHPERPVLAALLRGEPGQAFPEILHKGREPLAADFRKTGDGPRLGFLKIVAGVAGVPLDALINRDAQRRLRRVTAITLVAVAATLVMALMTTFALQSRNEAEAQREAAVGLVNYMITDLRTELQGVGRLDVMDGVNERALQYFTDQGDPSQLPTQSLMSWAQNLQAMGEDETKKVDRDLGTALGLFEASFSATQELYQRDPRSPDRIFSHAQSMYWVGWIAELREDFSTAHSYYEDYRNLSRELAKVEPDSERSLMELGYGELNMGIMSFKQRDLGAAGDEFERSIAWFETAQLKAPDSRDVMAELANAYAWLSDVHFASNEFEQALAVQLKAAELKRAIAKANPDDLEARFSLIIAERSMALARINLGDEKLGREQLEDVRKAIAELTRLDANNEEWASFGLKVSED